MTVLLLVDVQIDDSAVKRLTNWFTTEYMSAVCEFPGFVSVRMGRKYSAEAQARIGASTPQASHVIFLEFAGESERARWETSLEHMHVWDKLIRFARTGPHYAFELLPVGRRGASAHEGSE